MNPLEKFSDEDLREELLNREVKKLSARGLSIAKDDEDDKTGKQPVTYETNPGGLAAAKAAKKDVAAYFRR